MWKKIQITTLLIVITSAVSSAFTAAALVWYYFRYIHSPQSATVLTSRQSGLAEEFTPGNEESRSENELLLPPDSGLAVKRHSRQALTESVIRAIIAGDFATVRGAMSPDSRLRLDAALKKKSQTPEAWMTQMQVLGKKRLNTTSLEQALEDRALYDRWERSMMKRSNEEYELLDNQWYMLFKTGSQ